VRPTLSRIGFLIEPISFRFEHVRLEPLPDHADQGAKFRRHCNADGYFYPPLTASYRLTKVGTRGRRLPGTSRPALVFHLPASHTLSVDASVLPTHPHPHSDSMFILQVLAFITGTRLQFEQWRLDGRVPCTSTLGAWVQSDIQAHFVEYAYVWWRALPTEHQVRSINLFHAYNRAISAEFPWDVFTQQYMVFDGIYRLHAKLAGIKSDVGHHKRLELIAGAYGVPMDDQISKLLYRARNDLFHEAIWAGAIVGYPPELPDSHHFPRYLRQLNARLLCAMVGYRNSFTKSVWWAMGKFLFDRPPC